MAGASGWKGNGWDAGGWDRINSTRSDSVDNRKSAALPPWSEVYMMKLSGWIMGAVLAGAIVLSSVAAVEEGKPGGAASEQPSVTRTVGLGAAAAFAVAVSILGAGYAVGRIGSAAVGALAEKPELLAPTILFVALAEGLAVLGFAIAMMLLQKI